MLKHRGTTIGFALGVLFSLLAAGPVQPQTELTGQTASGAFYRIQVPDEWQPADGLVIWNHGFSLDPIGPVEDLGPLAGLHLAEGYAVAASSYSLTGWALFNTVRDNNEMVDVFEAEVGVPEEVFVYGGSLGGIVTAQAIEQGDLGNVVGALPICGALAGSKVWDGGLDIRLLYDFLCSDVPGGAIAGGAQGLPFPPDPSFDLNAMAVAVDTCLGVLRPPILRTAEQTQRLEKMLAVTGLPESFILTDMGFVTFGLADLVFDPAKLGGQAALGNSKVDYGDAAVNADIPRVSFDPQARQLLIENYTPNGKIGDVKIVSLHTDKDGLVLVENESDYAAKVPPSQFTLGIVVEDEPSHCDFTEAELVSAWENLRGWVGGLPQPSAAQLQAVCEGLDAGGLAQGPCRIDPGFVVPDIEDRVRRRDTCVPGPDALCLNDGRFRLEVDWRNFQGEVGDGRSPGPGTDDSGLFYFFNPDNWEMLVKVLDGCNNNGHYWVFSAATTNVEYTLRVTDTDTGVESSYFNPLRTRAPALTDTQAFATCP